MLNQTISHYRIVEKIGSGGMGVVYKALDIHLERFVALKVLPEHLVRDRDSVERLRREARAASALNEPGICTIHEIDEADGTVFIVMELLEGETLAQRLTRQRLPLDQVLDLGIEITTALDAAHRKGVVHRDITPANIFLTTSGRVKLLDFGLAKLDSVNDPEGATGQQQTMLVSMAGQLVGTPPYMSPEQAKGQPIDGRSDLFSLGLVLYEAVTGRRVFSGSIAELLSGVLTTIPPALSSVVAGIPVEVDRAFAKVLEKDRDLRYQTAAEWRADLKRLKRDAEGATFRTESVAVRRGVSARALMLGAAAVAVAAAIGFWFASSRPRLLSAPPLLANATFTQLTDLPGLESFPSLAPDGQSFVFASAHEGTSHIYLQRVGGRNLVALAAASAAEDTQPVFSPDGSRIAFRSSRDGGGIFVMGATGESVRRLTDFGYNPTWSPDGGSVAIATELVEAPTARRSYSSLWAVDIVTGRRQRVTDDNAVQPAWSPHNARIAYWRVGSSGNRDIYTVPVTGGAPVAVTDDAATDWSPSWSSDGRFLFFASDRGGSMNLWRVPIDETSGRTLGAPEAVTTPSVNSGLLSFSRDGSRIAYVSQTTARNVSRVALDERRERVGAEVLPVTRGTRYLQFPDLSPDGTSIVYTSDEKLVVSRVDGTGARRLTDGVYRDRAPRWSPDGSALSFYSNRTGTYEIWTVRPDGSHLQQVTFGGPTVTFFYPVWSPDGRRMAFGDLKNKASFLYDPLQPWTEQSPAKLPPAPQPGTFFAPWSWSAAGGLAGWALREDGQSAGVLVFDASTKRYRQVSQSGSRPAWLRDGKRLVVFDHGALSILDTATGRNRTLDLKSPVDDEFSLSPDGSSIYFMQSERQGDIWLITLGGAPPVAR